MSRFSARRVGEQTVFGKAMWVCKLCSTPMRYWGDEHVWVCDACGVVALPTPTDSFKTGTTHGRGEIVWEYVFYYTHPSKDKLSVSAENLVTVDVTKMVRMKTMRSDVTFHAMKTGKTLELYAPGESHVMQLDGDVIVGFIRVVRAPDDVV